MSRNRKLVKENLHTEDVNDAYGIIAGCNSEGINGILWRQKIWQQQKSFIRMKGLRIASSFSSNVSNV